MFRSWIDVYKECGALWIHSGNPEHPHALLTSGNHSSGFFNSRLITGSTDLLRGSSFALLDEYQKAGGDIGAIDRFVGPQRGATAIVETLSTLNKKSAWSSPEKRGEGEEKCFVFVEGDAPLPGEHVLLCEDVITTGGSVEQVADAVEQLGAPLLPFVCALVNRSGLSYIGGKKIVALIEHEMPVWPPEVCPLCQNGSKAIRPKDNWETLTNP